MNRNPTLFDLPDPAVIAAASAWIDNDRKTRPGKVRAAHSAASQAGWKTRRKNEQRTRDILASGPRPVGRQGRRG